MKVFFSYSESDSEVAESLERDLNKHSGFRITRMRSDASNPQYVDAMNSADKIVILFSKVTLRLQQREVDLARELSRQREDEYPFFLIPVRTDGVSSDEKEVFRRNWSKEQMIMDLSENWDRGVVSLARILSKSKHEIVEEQNRDSTDALIRMDLEIPEDISPVALATLASEYALNADLIHRSLGGSGLKIEFVEVLEESESLVGA